jgi:hypothetical protein
VRLRVTIGFAIGVLVLVFLLLHPVGGVDSLPPRCWSMFGYDVPCHRGVSVAGGGALAVIVGFILWLKGRPERTT